VIDGLLSVSVASSDDLECGDVAPLSFVFLFLVFGLVCRRKNNQAKESGVTSPHSKLSLLAKKPDE